MGARELWSRRGSIPPAGGGGGRRRQEIDVVADGCGWRPGTVPFRRIEVWLVRGWGEKNKRTGITANIAVLSDLVEGQNGKRLTDEQEALLLFFYYIMYRYLEP